MDFRLGNSTASASAMGRDNNSAVNLPGTRDHPQLEGPRDVAGLGRFLEMRSKLLASRLVGGGRGSRGGEPSARANKRRRLKVSPE